jgi:hypothetical protein
VFFSFGIGRVIHHFLLYAIHAQVLTAIFILISLLTFVSLQQSPNLQYGCQQTFCYCDELDCFANQYNQKKFNLLDD